MSRIIFTLVMFFTMVGVGHAQFIVQVRPPTVTSQPAGVFIPPALPVTVGGSMRTNSPLLVPQMPFAYWAWYPVYYPPTTSSVVINNYVPSPPSFPAQVSKPLELPEKPAEMRAKLTLNLPVGAEVWSQGMKVDASTRPLILESPLLQPNQSYTFLLKVSWREGDLLEERVRAVKVEAGDSKSLSYFAGR